MGKAPASGGDRPTPRVVEAGGPLPEDEGKRRLPDERAQFQRVVDEANEAIRELREQLRFEQRRREEAETELEALKKGAIGMMKYVTNLQRKKHEEEMEAMRSRLQEAPEGRPWPRQGRRGGSRRDRGAGEDRMQVAERELVALERETKMVAEENAYKQRLVDSHLRRLEETRGLTPEQVGRLLDDREAELETRGRTLERREKELNEQFQRLKEERSLRRAEADDRLLADLGQLPEMQRMIVERDEAIRGLHLELDVANTRYYRLVAALGRDAEGDSLSFAELNRARDEADAILVRLRHALSEKEKEVEQLKHDFQVKLRNTIAIQRIKYEREIEALKRTESKKGPWRKR